MIIAINPNHPEPRKIAQAVAALEAGEIVAYPTDTTYGLGCDLTNKKAFERLCQLKRLDAKHLYTFICPDLADIAKYAVVENQAYRVLRRCFPGPYCFVLEATREVPKMVQSKRKTVGIRVPNCEITLALARGLGRPILSTTACLPGEDPFIDPHEIAEAFPGVSVVIDGGVGTYLQSTVVDLTTSPPEVLREGAGPTDLI